MSSKSDLLHRQLQWASQAGLNPDARGYLNTVEKNLLQPLHDRTRKAFESGSGGELQDMKTRPAKMKALHSSSALAVNVFDYWVDKESSVMTMALELDSEITAIKFEEQYSTGLKGNPPNLDVVLELADGNVIGIESKFSEWLTPKTKSYEPFKGKYFPDGLSLWENAGLPKAQYAAKSMYEGELSFRYLDAAQLLKHALGMATQLGNRFFLYYIFHDWPGAESEVNKQEVTSFSEIVDDRLGFKFLSYQKLFNSLQHLEDTDDQYLGYLKERYSECDIHFKSPT